MRRRTGKGFKLLEEFRKAWSNHSFNMMAGQGLRMTPEAKHLCTVADAIEGLIEDGLEYRRIMGP